MRGFQYTRKETITGWRNIIWLAGCFFLLVNCSAGLGILVTGTTFRVQVLGLVGSILFCLPIFRPSWLKGILFCFALSFPLFGSFPYSTQSFLFILYLSFMSLTLTVNGYKTDSDLRYNCLLSSILFLYVVLSCSSLLLLPIRNIGWQFVLWDWHIFWNAVWFATPEVPLYSVAALNKLILYSLCVILLTSSRDAKNLYLAFFTGVLAAALWSSVIGILNYFNYLDLRWLRQKHGAGIRLQSVLANSGWFAEFLTVTVPYILLGFVSTTLTQAKKIYLFGTLTVCGIAITLTYARTGWIIYPFIIILSYCSYLIISQVDIGRVTWKGVAKVSLKGISAVFLTLCCSYFLVFHIFGVLNSSVGKEKNRFEQRIRQMTNPTERKVTWKETLDMVNEKPLFGFGYESFKLQNTVRKNVKKKWDTPHNLYLQLLVSGGVAGLTLWGMLIFATLFLLVADLIKNKTYFNIAVILSIVAFHLYGLAQAMQYIPMIWFLIFMNIGYAMTIDENVLPSVIRKIQPFFLWMVFLVVLAGVVAYAGDFESKKLAEREGLKIYSLDQKQDDYLGFYPAEQWGKQGVFRWTASKAIIKLPRAELFQLTFVCSAPDLADNDLILSVYDENKQIDEVTFSQQKSITREYYLPRAKVEDTELFFQVSRTWNLRKLGVANDRRNLGVAISEVKIVEGKKL